MGKQLTMLYAQGTEIGYARTGTYLERELSKRGIDVYTDDGHLPSTQELDAKAVKSRADLILREGRRYNPAHTNVASLVSVPSHMAGSWQGQYKSILTMWEAMSLPESFRDLLHEFDLIMVPSDHNVELFSRYHPNVQRVLLGVDPEKWHYIPRQAPGPFFNFLISGAGRMGVIGEPGPRKGVDVAYRAFRTVFKNPNRFNPVPRLLIKAMKGQSDYYGQNIVHMVGRLSDDEELALYESAHCYIQPSRGEGFGLQPLQALAQGIPTILTDGHGHASFAQLGVPIGWTPAKANYFIYGDAGEWWEPSLEEVCEAMWDVYSNYATHCEKAAESATTIARDFTWSRSADQFLAAHGDELSKPYAGNGEWVDPIRKMYRIITIRDFMAESAGRALYFEAGKTYYDYADIKRLLYDAGVLANECLDEEDHGLAEVQVLQMEQYRADHSYCPTCHQVLNSRPTAADHIEAELNRADDAIRLAQ